MDIEFSKWKSPLNLENYTVWPAYGSGRNKWTKTKLISDHYYTMQRIIRSTNSVSFESLNGFNDNSNKYFSSLFLDTLAISKEPMRVHMNLWLYKGEGLSVRKGIEIVIHSFKFTPK